MGAFDKVIGYEDIKAELLRFADVLKNYEKYRRLGVSFPGGILLAGEPGLGKTLLAKCFIEESGCRVLTLRKEKPDGSFVNQIKAIFEEAKKETGTIVFLDDMDKFANGDELYPDAEEYVAVQSGIDNCKGSGVFVLATVNNEHCLPTSLLRAGRFDKLIELMPPEGKDAEKIIKHYLSTKQIAGDLDIEMISRLLEGRSCAELETVINEAGIYAGYAGKESIGQEDLVQACMRMLFDAPECLNPDDAGVRYIAVHEAGHAVAAEVLNPGSVTIVSVCRHSGSAEGFTKTHRPEEYRYSKELQERDVVTLLGGKAAVEMVYGIACLGCRSDMLKAFRLVDQFADDECTLGFETYESACSSGYLLEKKDRLKAAEIDRYYRMAKRIMAENRAFLDALAAALVERKTVTWREIREIRRKAG